LLDLCKAAMTPTPTGGVIDQKRVFDSVGHAVCATLLKRTRIV